MRPLRQWEIDQMCWYAIDTGYQYKVLSDPRYIVLKTRLRDIKKYNDSRIPVRCETMTKAIWQCRSWLVQDTIVIKKNRAYLREVRAK